MEAFISIVGCPRSGTTLLRNMLNSHPDIFIFPQTQFFNKIWGSRWLVNFKKNRKQTLYADDLYMVSRILECSMEELVTGAKLTNENEYKDPLIGNIVEILNNLTHDQITEIRGMIRTYMMRHFEVEKETQKRTSEGGLSKKAKAR